MDSGSLLVEAWEIVPVGLLMLVGGAIAIPSGVRHMTSRGIFVNSSAIYRGWSSGWRSTSSRSGWFTTGSACDRAWAGEIVESLIRAGSSNLTTVNVVRLPGLWDPRGSCAAGVGAGPADRDSRIQAARSVGLTRPKTALNRIGQRSNSRRVRIDSAAQSKSPTIADDELDLVGRLEPSPGCSRRSPRPRPIRAS